MGTLAWQDLARPIFKGRFMGAMCLPYPFSWRYSSQQGSSASNLIKYGVLTQLRLFDQ